MDDREVLQQRLLEVIRRLGYGRVREIVVQDGMPVEVVAEVRIRLDRPVGSRLEALGPLLDRAA